MQISFMRKIIILFILLIYTQGCKPSVNIIELNPSDSMSITGKEPGQDTAINLYSKGDSIAVITNIGENSFEIRIETNGIKIKRAIIQPNETKEVELIRGQQLFFNSRLKSKAKVKFKATPKFF